MLTLMPRFDDNDDDDTVAVAVVSVFPRLARVAEAVDFEGKSRGLWYFGMVRKENELEDGGDV